VRGTLDSAIGHTLKRPKAPNNPNPVIYILLIPSTHSSFLITQEKYYYAMAERSPLRRQLSTPSER
jgi:hypothetical protein